MENRSSDKAWRVIFLCWFVAICSTLGSLFFSEVMEFPPCTLCWYQRIAMYPLVFIFMIGAFQGAKSTFAFSFPLVLGGLFFAAYHNLIHYNIIPESASPCREGVSCATIYLDWGGFITIPMLSLGAFSILTTALVLLKGQNYYEK